ncbi:MAG: amidohydrolase [Halanaeroarchaeum sp.]
MNSAADLVLRNGEVHTLADPDETADAVAVRDGRIVDVATDYESQFRIGVETTVVDLAGRVLLPGFVDAHTHMQQLGQYQVHADLSGTTDLEEALDRLRSNAAPDHEWILGFGYDESDWTDERRYPTREDLDAVATDRPVAAFRVDMHSASLNSLALDRLADGLPAEDVRTDAGEPTGVVVEEAAEVVWEAVAPDRKETHSLLEAAMEYANERGVTAVHDMVRQSHAPRAYRDMDAAGDLSLRVRLNYWADHLDAVRELGLRPGHGSAFVQVGAIKSYSDGSIGSRTAKLTEPYADDPGSTGNWVVPPAEIGSLATSASEADQQLAVHAIGDAAIDEVLGAFERIDDPAARHRIEHAELIDDGTIDRMESAGVVASVQPNFHRWARPDGLYDQRLGPDRRRRSNPLRKLADSDVPLAFGSDCMPLDPLYGIDQAVTAPTEAQRLTVTEALRAYTWGGAYAAFDEDRMGTIEPGKLADFVVLEDSPWERPAAVADIDVAMTVVDGTVVYDGRQD